HWRLSQEELERSRESLDQLREANVFLRKEKETFEDRLSTIEISLGWLFVLKARDLRTKVLRPGTVPGRCFELFSRFVKTAATAGFSVAARKAREKVARRLRKFRRGRAASRPRSQAEAFPQSASVDRFRELPWKTLGHDVVSPGRKAAYFKVLLVSHSA